MARKAAPRRWRPISTPSSSRRPESERLTLDGNRKAASRKAPGAAFFIGFFDRITPPRDRETRLRNKRLREIRGKIRHFLHCGGAFLRRLLCRMPKKPVF